MQEGKLCGKNTVEKQPARTLPANSKTTTEFSVVRPRAYNRAGLLGPLLGKYWPIAIGNTAAGEYGRP